MSIVQVVLNPSCLKCQDIDAAEAAIAIQPFSLSTPTSRVLIKEFRIELLTLSNADFFENMDGFPYEPLEGPRDIRLVHILPGQVDEPILCTIQHVSLDLSPEYNAISYTWGDLSIKHTIICDGTKVEITLNLFDALHQFRRRDNVHVIWADQLCIDQENIAERNMQVGVMGEIYSRCQSCLAFLGKAVGEDFDALDLVEDIAKISPATPLSQGGALRDTETDIDRFSARRDPRWKALYKFFGRPWFSRVWIIQEAVLSPRCALFYGSRESSLSVLGEFLQAILENSNRWNLGTEIGNDEKKAFGRDVNRAMALAGSSSIRKRIGNSKIVSDGLLYSNLALTRYAAATDPRDKIYGILGLVDHLQERVIPDYNMETAEVYNMIARRLVKSGEGLDTLYQAATNTPQSMEGLLSWAPDWSISNDRDTWLDVLLKQHIPHAPKSATVKLLPDLTSISIDGLIFDSIEAMTKIFHERAEIGDGLELDFLEHALEDWAAAESLFPDREWYPTGELAATAFWRTLVTNNIDAAATPMGEPKPYAEYVRKALEFAALQNLVQLV